MSLGAGDQMYTPEFDLDQVTARKRYYNTTYNSRHGKRRNFNAHSYIKQLEDTARQREKVGSLACSFFRHFIVIYILYC